MCARESRLQYCGLLDHATFRRKAAEVGEFPVDLSVVPCRIRSARIFPVAVVARMVDEVAIKLVRVPGLRRVSGNFEVIARKRG